MIKPGAKFFFNFFYTQDEKKKVQRDFRIYAFITLEIKIYCPCP